MPTFIYSPQVRVYIQTDSNGTLDVSEDLTQGDMVRRSDGVSTFNFGLMNARRKYDLKFAPNDRIVVLMKRITWVHTFTGYLNSVPLRTAWPREVSLAASCSLKRLQYYYWDPYSTASIALLRNAFDGAKAAQGQGAGITGQMLLSTLTQVVGWPLQNIHLGQIPKDWFALAQQVAQQVKEWSDEAIADEEDYLQTVGGAAVIGGTVMDRIRAGLDMNASPTQGSTDSTSAGTGSYPTTAGTTDSYGGGGNPGVSTGGYAGKWKPVFDTSTPRGSLAAADQANGRPAAGSATGLLKPGKYGGISLSQSQLNVAARIYELVSSTWVSGSAKINLPNQALWAAFATAMGESHFDPTAANNKSNPGVSEGAGNGTPGNYSSAYGVFQLLSSHGTVSQRANVDYSTDWFVNSMVAHFGGSATPKNLLGSSPGRIALITQGSDPSSGSSYYDQFTPMAKALTTAFNKAILAKHPATSGSGGSGSSSGSGSAGASTGTKRVATGADFLSTLLQLIRDHPNIPYTQHRPVDLSNPPSSLDCSAFVFWGVNHTLGNAAGCPTVSYAQAAWCKRISVSQALNTPGALVFVSSNGNASGVHHVGVCVGNGKDVAAAHHPGSPASVELAKYDAWSFGGLMPCFSYSGSQVVSTSSSGSSTAPVYSGGTNRWPTKDHSVDVPYGKIQYGKGGGIIEDGWDDSFHSGVDFVNLKYGDAVSAVDGGTVLFAGQGPESDNFGNYVSIRSGNIAHIYANLSSVAVSAGARVTAGQKIGAVGNSGNVLPPPVNSSDHKSGVHLHFEVRQYPFSANDRSVLINPVTFITKGLNVRGGNDPNAGLTPQGATNADGSGTSGTPADTGYTTYVDSGAYDPSSSVDSLFAEQKVTYESTLDTAQAQESAALTGAYTLANDTTVLQYISQLCSSSMRSFCSAPNGDFIAWFPDYYGLWGTAGVLRVEDIELQDFNVSWSDDNFVTHQFVQYALTTGLDPETGLLNTSYNELFAQGTGAGVANIDSPSIMAVLFGFPPENARNFAEYVYAKFGARPNVKQVEAVLPSKSAQFFMALFYFMLQWAYQYSASVPTTFMPEAWPGMLLQVPSFNFQAYITSVEHTFSFGEGGSFATTINICAPALLQGGKNKKDNSLIGLPLAGGYGNSEGLLTAANASVGKPSVVTTPVSPTTQNLLNNTVG